MREPGYEGAAFALLTRHGKGRVIAPLLREAFGARLVVVSEPDTDTLGTFTREVPRRGTQLEAARLKARLAAGQSALGLGLGSEGSFSPGLLGAWNLELVLLRDEVHGIEVVGQAAGPTHHHHAVVDSLDALLEFAHRAGFPRHALVLRPDGETDRRLHKGLRDRQALAAAFHAARCASATGRVFAENDLRAHQHPTRMATIERATRELLARLRCRCPACHAPGFGQVAPVPGLPCRDCGAPTTTPLADEYACVRCDRRERRARDELQFAEPSRCDACNP